VASVLSTRAAAARAAEVKATAQASLDTFLGAPRVHIDAHQPDDDESSARAFKASSEPEAAAAAAPVPLRPVPRRLALAPFVHAATELVTAMVTARWFELCDESESSARAPSGENGRALFLFVFSSSFRDSSHFPSMHVKCMTFEHSELTRGPSLLSASLLTPPSFVPQRALL